MKNSVAIAISAFRSDEAVISLLRAIFSDPHPEVGPVIVVDSMGTGDIAATAEARGWPLQYENAKTNLGSAGNLARRMEIASELDADWCLCLNHDANWNAKRLSAMLAVGRSRSRVGAVYPVLDHSPRKPRWEDGRRHFRPSAGNRLHQIPNNEEAAEVLWSSSNSALYSLEPLSENISVMSDLWLGYEDLAYGIALHRGCWLQLSCRSAQLSKVFDYTPRTIFGRKVYIPDKPAWYSYYNIRNLILIWRTYGSNYLPFRVILSKFFHSIIKIIVFEDEKAKRLLSLFAGFRDGIFGLKGKGVDP